MKVKELIKKYPGYEIIVQGYPNSIPFTQLPRELRGLTGKAFKRVCDELEIKGYKIVEKQYTSLDITYLITGSGERLDIAYKGTLYIYLKGTKRPW